MRKYPRKLRVADLIKEEIADIIHRKIKDPRIQGVTITAVRMTDDLKEATIFYCGTFHKSDRTELAEAMTSAAGFIRRELSERVRLKAIPRLSFVYDNSFDYGERIEQIIELIRSKGDEQDL
ncbi:MAG: 30S ribosome-binding factor RbfA [Syntrophobacterales bacterium]|nr:30S ribosome-binding factor RbfA [Syntrophobacterales bacterium]